MQDKKLAAKRIPFIFLACKPPPIICIRRQLNICHFFKNNKQGMIFHENRLLADDSHVISHLSFENWERCLNQNLLSAAVVIGALRVKLYWNSILQRGN